MLLKTNNNNNYYTRFNLESGGKKRISGAREHFLFSQD